MNGRPSIEKEEKTWSERLVQTAGRFAGGVYFGVFGRGLRNVGPEIEADCPPPTPSQN